MALAADEKEVEDGGKDAVRVIFLACLCKRGLLVCWVVICYTIDVIEYDRRRSELSIAALQMKKDNDSIEK